MTTIAGLRTGDCAFLVTDCGTPFIKESFGNWFRDKCRKAGCSGSVHGLRKAGATRTLENGATINQLMALFGWKTEKIALLYTRKADRRRLAAIAAPLLFRNDVEEMSIRMDLEQSAAPPVGCGSKPKTSRK